MPMHSATVVSSIVADNLIAPLMQFKEDLPTSVSSYMVTPPLPTADVWKSAYTEDKKKLHDELTSTSFSV